MECAYRSFNANLDNVTPTFLSASWEPFQAPARLESLATGRLEAGATQLANRLRSNLVDVKTQISQAALRTVASTRVAWKMHPRLVRNATED